MSQTVLVADDSRTIRKVVEMALKAQPFDVVGVGSAREALEAAQRRPSVILLDYYMPDGSGYDVCRALKGNAATRHIPVVMLGGTYKNFDPNLARECGADHVIMKPFKTDDLIDVLTKASAGSQVTGHQPAGHSGFGQAPAGPPPLQQARPFAQSPATRPAIQQQAHVAAAAASHASLERTPFPGAASARPQPVTTPESQSRISTGSGVSSLSQPRISPDLNTPSRQRTPTPGGISSPGISSPGVGGASGSGASALPINRAELENTIRDEVKKAVREELPGLLRNVMGEVFQQKVLPRLIKAGEDRIQATLEQELESRVTAIVRHELERLLSDE